MKVFNDFLSDEELDIVLKEIYSNFDKPNWSSSLLLWPGELINEGQSGTVLMMANSEIINSILIEKIKNLLNFNFEIIINCQPYVWLPHSSINWHTDSGYLFGATLYLNKDWKKNWGGLFVYENEKNELIAIEPKFNSLVLNDSFQPHMVTNISAHAKKPRITIQIFAKKKPL